MAAVPTSEVTQAQRDELMCTYAMLAIHDEGAEVTPDAMTAMIKAAGSSVEAYWPTLYCKMIASKKIGDMLTIGGGGGGAAAPAAGGDAGAAAGGAPAAKKEEVVEEEEEDMEFDLFD